jgi:hypothetical protein
MKSLVDVGNVDLQLVACSNVIRISNEDSEGMWDNIHLVGCSITILEEKNDDLPKHEEGVHGIRGIVRGFKEGQQG